MTYFELPEGFDADPSSTATGRRRSAKRRSLLQSSSNLGSNPTSGTSSPAVDENAAVVASIKGEIDAIAARLDGSTSSLQAIVTDLGVAGGNPAAYKQRIADYWGNLLRVGDDSIKDLQDQAQETLRVLDSTISVQQQVLESVASSRFCSRSKDELKATMDAIGEGEGDALGAACEHRTGLGAAEIFFNATKYPTWVRRRPPGAATFASFLHRHRLCRPRRLHRRSLLRRPEAAVASCRRRRSGDGGEGRRVRRRRRELLARSSSSTSSSGGGWTGAASLLSDWKGYDVMQGGATDQTSRLPPTSVDGTSEPNRMVGGLLIHQVRNQMAECDGTRFKNISAACRSKNPSTEPFGVDPVFRRPEAGQSSADSLYNVALEDFAADYYNTSAGRCARMIDLTGVGTPFGFFHREVPDINPGSPCTWTSRRPETT